MHIGRVFTWALVIITSSVNLNYTSLMHCPLLLPWQYPVGSWYSLCQREALQHSSWGWNWVCCRAVKDHRQAPGCVNAFRRRAEKKGRILLSTESFWIINRLIIHWLLVVKYFVMTTWPLRIACTWCQYYCRCLGAYTIANICSYSPITYMWQACTLAVILDKHLKDVLGNIVSHRN